MRTPVAPRSRHRRRRPRGTASALALAALVAVPASVLPFVAPASAITPIAVDETNDELNADGDCSLREAVAAVNAAADVDGCVHAGFGVISLAAATYVLDSPLVLTGAGRFAGAGVTDTSIECDAVVGACLRNSGLGSGLALEDLAISGGASTIVIADTGAGPLWITRASFHGGGTAAIVSDNSSVHLVDSYVTDNDGHGIATVSAPASIQGSIVAGNGMSGMATVSGTLYAAASTVMGNDGNGFESTSGSITILNSTVYANDADAARTTSGTISYDSATIVANRRALNITGAGVARFRNTVVAQHTVQNCDNPVESQGANLSDDDTCAFTDPTDQIDVDAGLAPLEGELGGPPHLPPAPGSPLLDRGANCTATDQLGQPRPTDGDGDGTETCDIGAIEHRAVPLVDLPEAADTTTSTTSTTTPPPADEPEAEPTDEPTAGEPTDPEPATPAEPVHGTPSFTG